MSLPSPGTVETLQKSLHEKAKLEPSFRFYSLYDKVCRQDVLAQAYRICKANQGSPGIDRKTFDANEAEGLDKWLGNLAEELRKKVFQPQPLRRVWIPKANGKMRPLGVPTVRCRVVQTALTMILGPIFEADLLPSQYGYRPGLGAKMAIRRIYFHITQFNRKEVVDADLADYFGSIPHQQLLKSIARRVSDKAVLSLIKAFLQAGVVEMVNGKPKRTNPGRKSRRGTCQGGPLSPLLANIYFRRFLLGFERQQQRYHELRQARIVSYADDFVICCKAGTGERAETVAKDILERIGLVVNEDKTRRRKLPDERFSFLGYEFGTQYGKNGRKFFGTRPSRKAISSVKEKIHIATVRNKSRDSLDVRLRYINSILRGWGNYFDQGPVQRCYREVNEYTWRRVRKWLAVKHKAKGRALTKMSKKYIYDQGLYFLPEVRADRARAKS